MFAEIPDVYTWLGSAVIIAAGLLVGWQSRRKRSLKEETMPYLVADDLPTASAGARFRALLERPGILQMPGTHNGLAALQAKPAGFEALYLSGAGDVGLDGPARSRRHHRRRGLLLHPPGRAGERACRCWSTATPATARR